MVSGFYRLQVTIHSFSNPAGMCAERVCSSTRCCDGGCPASCHYFFSLCLRAAGTPVSTLRVKNGGNCSALATNSSINKISDDTTFTEDVFGTPNPIVLQTSMEPVSYTASKNQTSLTSNQQVLHIFYYGKTFYSP